MRYPALPLLALLSLPVLSGCKSAVIDATVHNSTPTVVELIEVDYPSASFGVQSLAPGADFHYHFKIIGSGPLSLTYTDTQHVTHTVKGPDLNEGDRGQLNITMEDTGVRWSPALQHAPH